MFQVVIFAILSINPLFALANGSAVLSAVEKRYSSATSVTMDVEKIVKLKLLEKEKTSSGTIKIQRGGKLRWETTSPDHSLVLADGKAIWMVDYPAEEDEKPSIIKASNPKKSQPHAIVAFLMGQGKIGSDFMIVEEKVFAEKLVQLDLRPKKDMDQVQWLNLTIDQEKNKINHATFADAVGNVTDLDFKNIKFDETLDKALFTFKPPKGSDITVLH